MHSNTFSLSEPITTIARDGTIITGTLWLHESRRGAFKVEYNGEAKTDGRTDYTSEKHIKFIASMILTEMAESSAKKTTQS